VIEFGIGADRFPTVIGMAIRAWRRDRAMGIGHLGLGIYAHTYTGARAGTGTCAVGG